jgi:hypothetical protein
MFNDPNHPDLQTLAGHHEAGTHDTIPTEHAAAAIQSFHEHADPQLAQQVTDEHYEQLAPAQLQAAAQQFHEKIQAVASSSPEATQLAQIDPSTATPAQVSAMHRFLSTKHPEVARDVLIAGGAVAVTALAAFAASRYLRSRGR